MGVTVDTKEAILLLIDEHLTNVRELMKCLDFTEKDFKEQLQDEFRYFSDIRLKYQKDVTINESSQRLLESKLNQYKDTNKYRFNLASRIIEYNNYLVGTKEDVPF